MSYQELKIWHYNKNDEYEAEYQRRLNAFGGFNTHLYPYLIRREEFASAEFPLFSVPLSEIQLLTQHIQENSVEIQKLAAQLPGVALSQYYNDQLKRAIIATNEIEGVKSTRKEIDEALLAIAQNRSKTVRFQSMVKMYDDIQRKNKITISTLEDVREIYDGLMDGEIAKEDLPDGRLFRKGSVSVVDMGKLKKLHISPQNELTISTMLQSWIAFINSDNYPFLVKAILGHFFFENVHPFYDGNGRTGRYILSRYLSAKLDDFSGLIISQKINETTGKERYYKAFQITQNVLNRAEGTFFLETLMRLLEEGQKDIIGYLNEKIAELNNLILRIEHHENWNEAEKFVMYLLYQSQLFVNTPDEGIDDNQIITLGATREKKISKLAIKNAFLSLEAEGTIRVIAKKPKKHAIK